MSDAENFIRLACLSYDGDQASRHAEARDLLDAHPEIRAESIYAAAAVGDVAVVRRLDADPSLATSPAGRTT